jgi:hypothetical protein
MQGMSVTMPTPRGVTYSKYKFLPPNQVIVHIKKGDTSWMRHKAGGEACLKAIKHSTILLDTDEDNNILEY